MHSLFPLPLKPIKSRHFNLALSILCACCITSLYADEAAVNQTIIDTVGASHLRCANATKPRNQSLPTTKADESLPINIIADSAEGLLKDKFVLLDGNVLIDQGRYTLSADHATYQIGSNEVETKGNVFFDQGGIQIRADQINYNLKLKTGQAHQANYQIADIPAQGRADHINLIDAEHSEYTQITYTTCPADKTVWELAAETLEIDRAEGIGTAHNATLSLMDVPIAYLPWMSFPIDNRRRSGFLVPSIGYGDENGLDLTIPYYLNLAPNYDLTLLPRIMTERGLMLGGEFRFLTASTQGMLSAEYLPKDKQQDQYSNNRSSVSFQARSRFNNNISSNIQIEHVSDDDYLDDFGNNLVSSTTSLLQRNAELRYETADWKLLTRLKNYQVLNNGSEPYSILPQIKFESQVPGEQTGLLYHIDSEITHFSKNADTLEGTRFDIYPAVSLPMQDDYYHLTPKIGARYTQYALNHQTDGLDESPNRLTGLFSLDTGLYFERDTTYFGSPAQQTLEPRLYYLYTSRHEHDDIPLFDTGLYAFSTASLFRENRFNSTDRIGDANQISLSLTTRYNDSKTGREKLKASIGQIFYLQDREVNLSKTAAIDATSSSSIAGDFTAYISDNWHTRGNLIWDTNEDKIAQVLAQVNFRENDSKLFNMSYRLNNDVTEHVDISGIWPLGKHAKILAHWRYSMEEEQTQEAIAGIEYGDCCWRIRTFVRQHRDTTNTENIAFFVQLELNGLGKLGDDLEDLLTNSIYGYRREN